MPEESRIDAGRMRAASAKRAVALTAAGGFVVALALARQAHPGAAAAGHATQLSTPSALSAEVQQGLRLGGGSISSPATGSSSSGGSAQPAPAPQVQSSSS